MARRRSAADSSQAGQRASRFPDPRLADPDGLVAVGGRLEPDWLLDAYRHGIFPWPTGEDDPLLWWSPDPRALMPLDGFYRSARLRRRMRSGRFTVTFDEDFAGVMRACGTAPGREDGTWITRAMLKAYTQLHRQGHAHSVEVWLGEGETRRLVGGVYGVAIGGLFAAESMFHYETDASKVALATLVDRLNERGYVLLDIQQWTAHTGSLGAVEVSRDDYLARVTVAVDLPVTWCV
ncbi:Leucyl/phenylalanyl-tRNA--protein transferase [Botrimarina colliarenosi]|uniref:Leucyl/phenylalanyl-tRNA--protein transferase n=1 Tax=Botrimarina colliarenosi TaxID=2528001 RepID=A0A5C6A3W3_9BACT|nr:leucyl/phenylalanyl-tRNA--protein transferase [Botrimarina colliarenosi]TWT94090.1 Leucyl/phenylalanyl-tRNA--protein transferase [Botrimarina colliarenosi]